MHHPLCRRQTKNAGDARYNSDPRWRGAEL